MKICVKCKISKEIASFSKNKTKKDGLCIYCRDCYALINKEWRIKNKDKDKKIHDRWKSKNKDVIRKGKLRYYYRHHEESKIKSREYKQKNTDTVRIKNLEYANKKYQSDINYRLVRILRGRIWKALKRNSKYSQSLDLLGCSIEYLKSHLEKQFTTGMCWSNYGKWHIDHIKPCASFNLTDVEQQKICFHYSNLQPLWAKDNLKKSDKTI